MKKIQWLALFSAFVLLNPAYGLEIKEKNSLLLNTRNEDDSIYLDRFSVSKDIPGYDIKVSLFGESQWNLGISKWEKITSGVEADKPFLRYFYCGESVHFISGQILDYMTFDPGNMSVEATTKLGFTFPLSKKLSFDIRNEYSYNLEKGSAGLNEVIVEMLYKAGKNLDLGIGWHHTDRIHAFDSDYGITSLTLHF